MHIYIHIYIIIYNNNNNKNILFRSWLFLNVLISKAFLSRLVKLNCSELIFNIQSFQFMEVCWNLTKFPSFFIPP